MAAAKPRARQLVAVVGHRRIDDDRRAVGAVLAVSGTRRRGPGGRRNVERPTPHRRARGAARRASRLAGRFYRHGRRGGRRTGILVADRADDADAPSWWPRSCSVWLLDSAGSEFELPPLGDLPWQPGPSRPLRVVGFTDRVRLGEMGTLSEDQRMVFEFQLVDVAGERPYRPKAACTCGARS